MSWWNPGAALKLRRVIDDGRPSVAGARFTCCINERQVSCGRFVNGFLKALDTSFKERSLAGRWSMG